MPSNPNNTSQSNPWNRLSAGFAQFVPDKPENVDKPAGGSADAQLSDDLDGDDLGERHREGG